MCWLYQPAVDSERLGNADSIPVHCGGRASVRELPICVLPARVMKDLLAS